jgi:hypothetical protein
MIAAERTAKVRRSCGGSFPFCRPLCVPSAPDSCLSLTAGPHEFKGCVFEGRRGRSRARDAGGAPSGRPRLSFAHDVMRFKKIAPVTNWTPVELTTDHPIDPTPDVHFGPGPGSGPIGTDASFMQPRFLPKVAVQSLANQRREPHANRATNGALPCPADRPSGRTSWDVHDDGDHTSNGSAKGAMRRCVAFGINMETVAGAPCSILRTAWLGRRLWRARRWSA